VRAMLASVVESLNYSCESDPIQQLYDNFSNAEVCRYLDLIHKAEAENFKDKANTSKVLVLAYNIFEKRYNEAEKWQEKSIEEINQATEKLKLTIAATHKEKRKVFSKDYKSMSIMLNEEQDTAKRGEGAGISTLTQEAIPSSWSMNHFQRPTIMSM
jgi:erythromycin esterase-like protein